MECSLSYPLHGRTCLDLTYMHRSRCRGVCLSLTCRHGLRLCIMLVDTSGNDYFAKCQLTNMWDALTHIWVACIFNIVMLLELSSLMFHLSWSHLYAYIKVSKCVSWSYMQTWIEVVHHASPHKWSLLFRQPTNMWDALTPTSELLGVLKIERERRKTEGEKDGKGEGIGEREMGNRHYKWARGTKKVACMDLQKRDGN